MQESMMKSTMKSKMKSTMESRMKSRMTPKLKHSPIHISTLVSILLLFGQFRCSLAYPNCPDLGSSLHSHTTTSYNNNNNNNNNDVYYEDKQNDMDFDQSGNNGYDNEGRYYPEPPYVSDWYPGGSTMPQPCTEATSNPRGRYSSNLAPCIIAFHQLESKWQRVGSAYSLSDACNEDNIVPPDTIATQNDSNSSISDMILPPVVREYIQNWPDECVGDFQRCYEVPVHERYYFNFVCQRAWQFPEGATHMSVNCTADKAAKIVQLEKINRGGDLTNDPYLLAQQKRTKEEIHELEIVLFVVLALVLCSCFGCLCATYALVIRPYQESVLTNSSSTERDELMQTSNNDMQEAQIA